MTTLEGATVDLTVGDAHITRIEESCGAVFPVDMLLPAYTDALVDEHGAEPFHHKCLDPETNLAVVSIHTWLVRTPSSTILIDTCNGNHKERPAMPIMHQLDTPWLDRLQAAGVSPAEVDTVICTHLHLDHVGWNTTLKDGEWVPTFPNARYLMNRTEYDFWTPDNPASAALEFNANVFDDSVAPVFDRDLVDFWDGDHDIDGLFHLELTPGHTPGHAACWLTSGDTTVLFAGDTMHSPMQVWEPSWNSGFCVDPDTAATTRRALLERCVERNAYLLPAHFPPPHVYKVAEKGNGFAATTVG